MSAVGSSTCPHCHVHVAERLRLNDGRCPACGKILHEHALLDQSPRDVATLPPPQASQWPIEPGGLGHREEILSRPPDQRPTLSGPPAPPVPAFPAVPGYEILGVLGRGGMGVVYQARQRGLDRLVALKMLLSGPHAGPDQLRRFRTEAQAIARLQHPNIVQVHEVGTHDGRPFFSMEFCPGGSLDRKLQGNPLPPKEAARLAETLARAVHAAHQAHVVHRDLKPANVLLAADGTLKITDFGLAKRLDEAGQTNTGEVMGTPNYMAPEQAGGRASAIGPATDMYALGAMLYEFLTGRPPFKAATSLDTILQVIGSEPVPVRQLQPVTPRDLETICLKCLQKVPAKRYAAALDLAEDLRLYQAGEPIQARPVGRLERGGRWVRRNPVVSGLAAGLVAALTAGLVFSALFAVDARQQAQAAKQAEAKAKEAEAKAEQEAHTARAREYDANMLLTQTAWEQSKVPRFLELLESQRPTPGKEDLGGFEWHYWKAQARRGTLETESPCIGMAFTTGGLRLALAGTSHIVRIWDPAAGRELLTLKGHTQPVTSVAFSRDGKRLASVSQDRTVKLWHAATGQETATLNGHTGEV